VINNWHGSLVYSNSFFFESPAPVVVQTGTAQVNITMIGNAFWGDNNTAGLSWDLASGGKGRNSAVGNLLCDYGAGAPAGEQSKMYTDIVRPATQGTIAAAIDDFRRLGLLDLQLNHPGVALSTTRVSPSH
jgi:hypothetical protein